MREFLRLESASGVFLLAAAVLALLVSNSPLEGFYDALLSLQLEIRIDKLLIAKPLLLWINDGLMAVFFLLVGLEVKAGISRPPGSSSGPASRRPWSARAGCRSTASPCLRGSDSR